MFFDDRVEVEATNKNHGNTIEYASRADTHQTNCSSSVTICIFIFNITSVDSILNLIDDC